MSFEMLDKRSQNNHSLGNLLDPGIINSYSQSYFSILPTPSAQRGIHKHVCAPASSLGIG